MFQLVVVEVGGSQRHHEVAESDERTVGVCEQTDNHVTIEDSHGRLVPVQDTVIYRSGGRPVEHPRTVVLHLSGHEVKVPGLVVSDPNIELVILRPLRGFGCWPANLIIKTRLRPEQQHQVVRRDTSRYKTVIV